MTDLPDGDDGRSDFAWTLKGARAAVATPGVVLAGSYVGFGALANDLGWPLWAAALSTVLIWASPAQVVLLGALAGGAGIAAASVAVTLSGVRLLPMVVSLMPTLRGQNTSLGTRILAAHFIAVTAWIESLRLTPTMPRERRLPFFFGLANTLVLSSTIATAIGHLAAGLLPVALSIGLLALTPIYFLLSLERGADGWAEKLAMVFGFALAPVVHMVEPQFDLLWTGLIGGTAAFGIQRLVRRRGENP